MSTQIPVLEMLLRLLTATACGALLGLEREARGKAAGLRTFTMVSLGSASFTLLTVEFTYQMLEMVDRSPIYVSVGHKISLETSLELVRKTTLGGYLPEPLLKAHIAAKDLKSRSLL